MSVTYEFDYFKPRTLGEVGDLLYQYGNQARILAGGTDLVVQMKEGLENPKALIDIKGIERLKGLELKENELRIGALATFSELLDSQVIKEQFPVLWESARHMSCVGIRNRATVVGNICSAVPSLESGPALLIYDAQVHARGTSKEHLIPIQEWFVGPKKTARKDRELITGISLQTLPQKHAGCYAKLGRTAEDLAQVGVGVLVMEDKEYRIAFCAVGPVPQRAEKIEELLQGKELTPELLDKAKSLVPEEISPITDLRATKEYRMHMAQVMLERCLKFAVSRALGNGPAYGINPI